MTMLPINGWMTPSASQEHSEYRWATVTALTPLTIQLDGDTQPLAIEPDTLANGFIVGDRVWCQLYRRRVIILGIGGGPH